MVVKSKYVPTTITADFDVSVDVEIGIEEVQDWLDKASAEEIAKLTFDSPYDDEEAELPHGAVTINCGHDAGSLHDLDGIQAILDTMDVSEVLRKLAA